jgi:uncharacterized protein
MTTAQIHSIAQRSAYPDQGGPAEIVETHAHWIILSPHFAFKIKKNIRFSFLDYSTLEKRRHFCHRELELNRRLTRGVYLRVLFVVDEPAGPRIAEADEGNILDYAIQLTRMDAERHMPLMLEKGQVRSEHILQIAHMTAYFHQHTEKVFRRAEWQALHQDFSDVLNAQSWVESHLGEREAELLAAIVSGAGRFLERMEGHIQYRNDRGLTVDGHGDLHSGNIFLLDQPVLFDCIEFNDHFRQLDVLDEIAFLYMDLCFHRRPDLAQLLLDEYLKAFSVVESPADLALFYYFLSYRANVRFKIGALQAEQSGKEENHLHAKMYWNLLKDYYILLQKRGWFSS